MSDHSDDLLGVPFVKYSRTSIDAAMSITTHASRLQKLVFDIVYKYGPITDEGISDMLSMSANTTRPRRLELSRKGRIKEGQILLTRSGRKAVGWIAA